MKKRYIVKNQYEFTNIIKTSKYYRRSMFTIYIKDNNLEYSRFGISVATKIGNAVIRNKVKRQMRNIIDNSKNVYKKNLDYIIIVKTNYLNYSYDEVLNEYSEVIKYINK